MERFLNWITYNLPPRDEFWDAVATLFQMVPGIASIFAAFLVFSLLFYGAFSLGLEKYHKKSSFDLQKTVTFGDASSVRSLWLHL